ncbi:MAG: GNAT family N-acetyltransferase [Anaerolineae bacterium]
MEIHLFSLEYLPELQRLINQHISTVFPGWGVSATAIERHLQRNSHQPIIDPWVTERKTWAAFEQGRLVAAAHLLRYGTDDPVGEHYRGVCDIAWLLADSEHTTQAAALLHAGIEHAKTWGSTQLIAWDSHLPTPMIFGIPDVWSHLIQVFAQEGFEPMPSRREALYGGWIRDLPPPGTPPIHGLTLKRSVGRIWGTRFTAWLDGEEIAFCECSTDLSEGGEVPSLRGWGLLGELYTHDAYRSRGVGRWLIESMAAWMRMAGCDRIVLSCAEEDEQAGAGRFYQRLGWEIFTRLQDGWHLKTRP